MMGGSCGGEPCKLLGISRSIFCAIFLVLCLPRECDGTGSASTSTFPGSGKYWHCYCQTNQGTCSNNGCCNNWCFGVPCKITGMPDSATSWNGCGCGQCGCPYGDRWITCDATPCQSCPPGQFNSQCGNQVAASMVNGGYSTPGMCTACASCPAGQYRINCAGLSAGTCAACPQSTTCPAAGQFLSGCSGTSLGTCQTCNNLQATSSAAGWSYSPPGAANRTVLPIRTPATLALSNNPCAAGACGGAVLRPVAALGSAWVQPPALLNELRCFCVPHDFPTIDPLRVVVAARAPRRREPDHPVCEQLPCMDYLRLQYASHHACCSSCNRNVRQLLLQREHVFK